MKTITALIFLLCATSFANVTSPTGTIDFDVQCDGRAEMTLNSIGLGVGVSPSTNLHIGGNAIISNQLFVGGSSGSSNLNINGTMGFSIQQVSANTTLGANTYVIVDSSSANIFLALPYAGNVAGRIYRIKKTSLLNSVWISGGGNLIDDTNSIEMSNSLSVMSSISLISSGLQWHIIHNMPDSSTAVASSNLVIWWKMDAVTGSTLVDSVNGIQLTPGTGMSVSGNTNIGVISKAQKLGKTGYYTTPGNAYFVLNSFTFSLWIKPDVMGVLEYTSYLSNQLYSNGTGFIFGTTNSTIKLSAMQSSNVAKLVSFNSTTSGNWMHIAATMDGTTMKIYKDGNQQGAGATAPSPYGTNIATEVKLGGNFEGAIDDVRVYNRALTQPEIKAISLQN